MLNNIETRGGLTQKLQILELPEAAIQQFPC
jgi:hypothetical protein